MSAWRSRKIFRRAGRLCSCFVCFCLLEGVLFLQLPAAAVWAQASEPTGRQPAHLNNAAGNRKTSLAELPATRTPASNILQTDVTPQALIQGRTLVAPPWRFRLFQKLPARLWFNATTEEDQRLETNVYQTRGQDRCDYVFRSLPNLTAGYNLLNHGSIYCNYFLIKDLFVRNNPELGPPTTQSVSLGFRHDWDLSTKSNFQIDYQIRELWIQSHLRQADHLPAVNYSRVLSPASVFFAGAILQLRSNYFFQGATREIDPFYSAGVAARRGNWVFVLTDTFVTNFRRHCDIVPLGASTMVTDLEVFRPVNSRLLPGLVCFARLEPIFNWSSHKIAGQSGTDVRLYSGLRMSLSKPAYHATMETIRKQILEAEQEDNNARPSGGSAGEKGKKIDINDQG
jgi:hypothetical protein